MSERLSDLHSKYSNTSHDNTNLFHRKRQQEYSSLLVRRNVRDTIAKLNKTHQGEKVCVAIFQTCAVSLVILVRHGCVILNIFTREVKTISTLSHTEARTPRHTLFYIQLSFLLLVVVVR